MSHTTQLRSHHKIVQNCQYIKVITLSLIIYHSNFNLLNSLHFLLTVFYILFHSVIHFAHFFTRFNLSTEPLNLGPQMRNIATEKLTTDVIKTEKTK
jgi:hypothetical protein